MILVSVKIRNQHVGIITLITHLSPLGWEHINLSGDYVWRTNLKLGQGKYRALRSVNSNMYKKQA